jgi:hypothetical protein
MRHDQAPAPTANRPRSERGSALVITLMILVIMTVFGLSFLMISETENQISVADRDGRQVLYVALSGARIVESWFNVPDPAENPFVPDRDECNLDRRKGDSDYDGANDIDVPANGGGQRYRGGTAAGTYRLFDKPFRGAVRDTFWGSYSHPDILIRNDPNVDGEYLDRMSALFNSDGSPTLEGVELLEMRIFAPPYDQDLQRRFGICTAVVRAAKVLEIGGQRRRVAERTVSVVLQELPFPAPGSGIEAALDIGVKGNFGVHWGGTYTEGNMSLQDGSNFPGPGVPRENTSRFRYADFSPSAPDLDAATPGTQNLLWQLLTEDGGTPPRIRDPWLNFRADGAIAEATNTNDQPWPYDYAGGVMTDKSIFFQNQTYVFPTLDYDFWKQFAQQRGRNANYYKYAGAGPLYQRNGVGLAEDFEYFVNTERGLTDPGIFFFDTTNSLNPQNGGGGVLVPELKINSSMVDFPKFIMEGLIYTNAELVDSSGISGKAVDRTVNMPAEPFLDTGIDIDRDGTVGNTFEEIETVGNGIWDFAYIGSTESDGQYFDDVYGTADFLAFEASHRFADGVMPHAHADPRIAADVIHEPFLNFAYPEEDAATDPVWVDYDFEALNDRVLGGDRDEDGNEDLMTSLRDRRGAQVTLNINLNGVWYNEGRYEGSGNLPAFGAVMFRAGFSATGSPDIYFNEGLLLGDWPPPDMKIPRVYVSHLDVE